jgi:hypothetical protein
MTSMTYPSIADFTVAHCIRREDGVLVVSPGAVVTFTPTGQFFEMKIVVEGRTVASAVLHKDCL